MVHLLELLRSINSLEAQYEPPLTATLNALKDSRNLEAAGQKSILIERNAAFFGRFGYSQNAHMQMYEGSAWLNYAILRLRPF